MLSRKKKYLQVALNSTPYEGEQIIATLPISDRILIEAGTPLIKAYGVEGIKRLKYAWEARSLGFGLARTDYSQEPVTWTGLGKMILNAQANQSHRNSYQTPSALNLANTYIVADTKCFDRGKTEVEIAKQGGADAATVMGAAPIATINYFIESCQSMGLDSMVDMMGVEYPIQVLRKLKKLPTVVILHRGVDEETFDKHKPIPYVQINKIRSSFDVMISIAGGDSIREVQRAAFNDADIVVVWKSFYTHDSNTGLLAEQFLKEIK